MVYATALLILFALGPVPCEPHLLTMCVPMAPSPGTPVGGERPWQRRSNSPAGNAAAAGAGPPGSTMEIDDAGLGAMCGCPPFRGPAGGPTRSRRLAASPRAPSVPVCGLSPSAMAPDVPEQSAMGVLLARLCLALTRSKPARPQLCDTSRKQPGICGGKPSLAWQELLMLPKTVLDAPRRGGRQHQKAVVDRLQR